LTSQASRAIILFLLFRFFLYFLSSHCVYVVGHGAYGIVIAARDHEADEDHSLVAIKKIERAFEHKIFTKRTLRELKILRLLQHENVKPDHRIYSRTK
jgi:serine/threonine protein kinase